MSSARAAYKVLCESRPLVVLDVETTPADDGDHIISIAAATWRHGRQRSVWSKLIDPGVPITNSQFHGLTDTDVAGHATFAEAVVELDQVLAEPDTILVCHNAAFDVGRLHLEYRRLGTGARLPDVPVIDTMKLPAALDYAMPGRGRSLASMCAHFGITNRQPHEAASDVAATGAVLHELLRIAATAGSVDLGQLHAETGGLSTKEIAAAPAEAGAVGSTPTVELPAEHIATHTALLNARASAAELDAWSANAHECARLRCPLLVAKAQTATHHARELHPRLTQVLVTHAADFEPGQGATIVAALNILAREGLRAGKTTRSYKTWWEKHRHRIQGLVRCHPDTGQCASCRDGDPCPIDTAHQPIVAGMCCDANDFVTPERRKDIADKGPSGFIVTWTKLGLPEMAGYAAWLAADTWLAERSPARADAVIDHAVSCGALDPRIIRLYAQRLTLQGRHAEVDTLVRTELAGAAGNTDPGWHELAAWYHRNQALRKARPSRPAPSPGRSTRVARPATRTRAPRFSL